MKCKFYYLCFFFVMFSTLLLHGQERTITGNVTDETGPLPGVSVLIEGTTTGTETDFDGNYSLKADVGTTIRYSFVGMTTLTRTVGANDVINIIMVSDNNTLDEVVITAFGVKKQKRSLGYAATAVTSEELTEVSSTNPLESLSGKIAGVDITSPSQPGASTKVIMRGFTTFGSNAPLYVIDGTPISAASNSSTNVNRSFDGGTNINDLDPNSIESINILKGGPAAALYGSRAQNGAIIITTKKGRAGQKLSVEINSSVDVLEVARIPHLQQKYGQGWNGVDFSGLPTGGRGATNENGSWGPEFNGFNRVWGQIVNNAQQIKPYENLENNIKDFYNIGHSYNNSVRVSGGGESSDFSLIFSKQDTDGIIPTDADSYKKNTLNLNTGLTNGKFKVRVSANYAQTRQNAVNTGQGATAGQGNTFMQQLIQIPRGISVIDMADYKNNAFNSNDYFYTPYSQNPYWVINENTTSLSRERFYGNLNFSYQFTPKLSATWQVGTDILNGGRHSHGAVVNFTPGSANALLGTAPIAGGVTEATNQTRRYETFLNLNYNTEISDDFGFEASGGITYRQIKGSGLIVAITDLDIPNFYEISNTAVLPFTAQNNFRSKNMSVFGTATISFKERVYLNLTARNEWTSTLTIGNNSYFYPSANLSAIVIDNGAHFVKLRSGISRLANGAPLYRTQSTSNQAVAGAYFGAINFPFNGLNSFEIGRRLGNTDIEPEFTTEIEFGLEGAFFNNRITTDITYYNKQTEGVIVGQQLPNSTGYGTITGNFIDIENKGFEVALGLVPIQTENFKWNIDYTFTQNKNKVLSLPEGIDNFLLNGSFGINYYAVKGQPVGVFKGRTPQTNSAGQIVVDPNTGIPLQTTDEQDLGTSERDFVMGLRNTFKYKNFKLSFGFDWKEGGVMYSYTSRLLGFTGNSLATTYNERKPFIVPNSVVDDGNGVYSENITPISFGAVTGYYSANNNPSTEATNHVIDKTFIRLRNLSLSYSLPSDIVDRLKFSKISFSIYGKNLVLWTPDENPYVDPEVSTFGSDLASEFGEFAGNPAQRTYGFAVKLAF